MYEDVCMYILGGYRDCYAYMCTNVCTLQAEYLK